jgi:hypothetical protein
VLVLNATNYGVNAGAAVCLRCVSQGKYKDACQLRYSAISSKGSIKAFTEHNAIAVYLDERVFAEIVLVDRT